MKSPGILLRYLCINSLNIASFTLQEREDIFNSIVEELNARKEMMDCSLNLTLIMSMSKFLISPVNFPAIFSDNVCS